MRIILKNKEVGDFLQKVEKFFEFQFEVESRTLTGRIF